MAFDSAAAVNYGRFVSVAYAMYTAAPNNPTPPPLPLPSGYKFIAWVQMQDFIIASSGWSFYGIVAQSMADPNRFVLAIRGTSNPIEWFDDATSLILAPWAGQGHVGYGFNRIYQTLRIIDVAPQAPVSTAAFAESLEHTGSFADQVAAMTHRHAASAAAANGAQMSEALAPPSRSVDVVGHSLGSALATLYVAENASKGAHLDGTSVKTPLLCTFASPRVGDATFAAAFDNLGLTSWRIVNQLDVVPYLPPADFGFVHVQAPQDYNSGFRVRWSVGCWHALATCLHLLDPKMPLGSGCAIGAGATLAARVAPPRAEAAMEMGAAPNATLFDKRLTLAASPSGHGTTVTIKISVEGAE